jgi:hypothetical protein
VIPFGNRDRYNPKAAKVNREIENAYSDGSNFLKFDQDQNGTTVSGEQSKILMGIESREWSAAQ